MTAEGQAWAVGGTAPPAPVHIRVRGDAADLHARGLPSVAFDRAVEVLEVDRPALVLGSTQRAEVADAAACAQAGVDVARRRSGGGVVLVDPGGVLWVDVLLPATDPQSTADVSSSAWWLGDAWVRALAAVGVAGAVVHKGSLCLNRWGRLVCFAGLGGGEVTIGDGGPKVVGIAQRRTRWGARFQCAVPLAWDPARLVGLLAWPSDDERAAALDDLSAPGLVAPVDPALAEALLDAFVAEFALA